MSDADAPTIKIHLEPGNLMDTACSSLGLIEYDQFRSLVENEQVTAATELLQKIIAEAKDPNNPDLVEYMREFGNSVTYYEAADEQLDKAREVSDLLDRWTRFLASDNSHTILADYAAQKLSEWTG